MRKKVIAPIYYSKYLPKNEAVKNEMRRCSVYLPTALVDLAKAKGINLSASFSLYLETILEDDLDT